MIKIWIDKNRPAPDGYMRADSTENAIKLISIVLNAGLEIWEVSIDNGYGDLVRTGIESYYIRVLEWMERQKIDLPIHIHAKNPETIFAIRAFIDRNVWTEIYDEEK